MRRALTTAGLALAITGLVAACSGVHTLDLATPPDTTAAPTTSTLPPPNYTGIPQSVVRGATTTTSVAIGPGHATLTGVVIGPSGPVAGATVEADRIVGSAMASQRATTAADGSWSMANIAGGRYRVRAWQAPTLDMATPQIFFLGGSQSMPVPLTLNLYGTQAINSAANPLSAPVGEAINVEVSVSAQTVDSDGFVSYQPSPGIAVSLSAGGPVSVGQNPVTTDADGLASFTLVCGAVGNTTATATTPTGTASNLPGLSCFDDSASSSTTTTDSSGSTSSTTTSGTGTSPTSAVSTP